MKKLFTAIACIFVLALTSCQFSETIYINNDGSGSMTFSLDASELMEMASDMGEGNEQKGLDKAMDSTVVFNDFLEEKKDSIAGLPLDDQKVESFKDYKMHMVVDPETSKMTFDLITEFKSVDALKDIFKAMNSFSNLQGKSGDAGAMNPASSPFSSMGSEGSTKVSYVYNGHTFKRSAVIVDKEKHQQAVDSLGDSAMMFGSSKYTLNYHFPRPIKSVSNETALFSEDRKSLTLEVGFMDILVQPDLLDLEVVLEEK